MTDTFEALLAEKRPDGDAVQQAARYYLAETTGDMDAAGMLAELESHADSPGEVESLVAELRTDPVAVEAMCLSILGDAWDDGDQRDLVSAAIDDAKEQMPVIEASILAVVAMYGMYLKVTGGWGKVRRVKRHAPDGTIEEIEEIEFQPPDAPLRAIVDLTRGWFSRRSG